MVLDVAQTVLVTGGAGFIGSWTCELLVGSGYNVVIVDDFSSGSIENIRFLLDYVKIERADISDYEKITEIIRTHKPEAIIHLAARVSVDEVGNDPRTGYNVNVTGTFNLLEAARRFDIERFVYASSAAVYGEPVELPIKETHPLQPINVYGATKLAGEALVHAYRGNYGLSTIALRYFNVYGPKMKPGPYAGVIYKFLKAALLGKPIEIYGDGAQTRDFVFVADVARANVQALKTKATGAYNVGTGTATSIENLAKMVLFITGRQDVPILYKPPRKSDITHSYADISRTIKDLSWTPEIDLLTGLKITLEHLEKTIFYRF